MCMLEPAPEPDATIALALPPSMRVGHPPSHGRGSPKTARCSSARTRRSPYATVSAVICSRIFAIFGVSDAGSAAPRR